MIHWIQSHVFISTLIGYYVFSSVVSAMPSPDEKSGKGYKFLFALMHGLAANLLRIPQVRNMLGNAQDEGR